MASDTEGGPTSRSGEAMGRNWEETRQEFRRIALRLGVTTIAQEITANRTTVYRLMDGVTRQPHPLTRQRVEDLVREHGRSDTRP